MAECCEPGCSAEVLCPVHQVLADLRAQVAEELPSARDDFSGPYTALEWVLDLLGGESDG